MTKIACFLEEWYEQNNIVTKNIGVVQSKSNELLKQYYHIKDQMEQIKKWFYHLHFFHFHFTDHNSNIDDVVCNALRTFNYAAPMVNNNILEYQTVNLPLYLANLTKEFLYNQDLDNNGLIYGKDFRLHNFDPMKLEQMYILEYWSGFIEWFSESDNFITFYEYTQTLDEQIELHDATTLYHLFHELIKNEDVDNNGLIYGRDFRIYCDDPLKNNKLNNAEYYFVADLKKSICNNFMSYQEYLATLQPKLQRQHLRWIEEENICSILLMELRTGLSLTSNEGFIYGKNYLLNKDSKPAYLKKIEDILFNSPYYNRPKQTKSFNQIEAGLKNRNYYRCFSSATDEILNYENIGQVEKAKANDFCPYYCARLIGEWNYKQDLDNNSLIYGIDFYLSDDDPKKIPVLKKLERDISWGSFDSTSFDSTSPIELFYNDYLETLPFNDILKRG